MKDKKTSTSTQMGMSKNVFAKISKQKVVNKKVKK